MSSTTGNTKQQGEESRKEKDEVDIYCGICKNIMTNPVILHACNCKYCFECISEYQPLTSVVNCASFTAACPVHNMSFDITGNNF